MEIRSILAWAEIGKTEFLHILHNIASTRDRIRGAYADNWLRTSVAAPDGTITSFTYDGLNRLHAQTNPSGATVTRQLDGLGDVVRVEISAGTTESVRHVFRDNVGNVIAECRELGVGACNPPLSELSDLVDSREIDGQEGQVLLTTYELDNEERVARVQSASRRVTQREVNSLGLPTRIESFGAEDPTDLLLVRTLQYDEFAQASGRSLVDPDTGEEIVVEFAYDGRGHPLGRAEDSSGVVWRRFDPLGREIRTRSFDSAGQLLTDLGQTVDAVGHPYSMSAVYAADPSSSGSNPSQTTWFQYDTAGRFSDTLFPNGLTLQYVYDQDSNLGVRTSNDGSTEIYGLRLLSPGDPSEDEFGAPVGLSGETLAVAGRGTELDLLQRQDGTTWIPRSYPGPESADDGYGDSVVVDGDWMLVGGRRLHSSTSVSTRFGRLFRRLR